MITRLKEPYEISFTGNPMLFVLQATGQIPEYLNLRVLVEMVFNSRRFEEVYLQKVYPNTAGQVHLDVASIIDPYLEYYTPRADLKDAKAAPNHVKRYRLEVVPDVPDDLPVTLPTTYYAIKGGLAYEAWHRSEFFTQVTGVQKKPLQFKADGELTDADALEYMYWLYQGANYTLQTVAYKVYYSDGTTASKTLTKKLSVPQYTVCCTPAGFAQNGLHLLEPAKTPVKWSAKVTVGETSGTGDIGLLTAVTIQTSGGSYVNGTYYNVPFMGGSGTGGEATIVISGNAVQSVTVTKPGKNYVLGETFFFSNIYTGGSGNGSSLKVAGITDDPIVNNETPVVEEFFYELDHRHFYDAQYIMYRNSVGGLQSIRLTGEVELKLDYKAQDVVRTVAPSWYNPHLGAQIKDEFTEESMNYSGNTGWLSKAALDQLRDLFLSLEKWMYSQNGRLLPIASLNRNVKFYTNKDRMYSATIAWQLAFINSSFTPASLMPQVRICPQVVQFLTDQNQSKSLTFLWALEEPYNNIEIQVVFPNNDTYIYTYSGNTGTATERWPWIDDNDPPTLTVKARTICNPDSDPAEYGSFTTISVVLYGDAPPIAVNDYYEVPVGFSGVLPFSLLANDYDPDGDDIVALQNWGLINNGAVWAQYGYGPDGVVTINADPNMTGKHTIEYQIHTPGKTNFVTGYFTINFGTGPQNVFVKWVFRNVTTTSNTMDAEAWIDFYSDAACTIPYDITALNLTINARVQKKDITGGVQKTDNYTFVGAGTQKMIRPKGSIYYRKGVVAWQYENVFTILPGNGYIPVNP